MCIRDSEVPVVLVANQSMQIPRSKLVRLLLVPHGADAADDKIVESINAGDVVITGDIPLAARVVEKSAIAIGTRGELYDDNSVHERLASRNLMEQFRSAGVETSGPQAAHAQRCPNVRERDRPHADEIATQTRLALTPSCRPGSPVGAPTDS